MNMWSFRCEAVIGHHLWFCWSKPPSAATHRKYTITKLYSDYTTIMSHNTSVRGQLLSLRFGGDGSTKEIHLGLQGTEWRMLIEKFLSSTTGSMMMKHQLDCSLFFPISLISQFTPIGLWPSGPALSSFLPSRGSSILQWASEGLCRAAALWLLSEGLSAVKCTWINECMCHLTLASTVVSLTMFSSLCWWLLVGLGPRFFFSSCFCIKVSADCKLI